MASTTSTPKAGRSRIAAGIAAAGIILSLSACSGQSTEAKDSSSTSADHKATTDRTGKADHTVHAEAALTRDYNVPTLAEFARQPLNSNVIRGTVTATRSVVTPPANIVETILTVSVERQRDGSAPTTAEVREPGGVVTVAQIRSDFESKLGRKLTDKELAQTADYRFNEIEHAKVGDLVLIVVADDPSTEKAGAYTSRARLALEGASIAGKTSGEGSGKFTWPGKPMNPKWESGVDTDSLM
ncbi:hypothetical protein [Streptomyces sp. NPDC056401]|uniref:hypothetical protein n=1 Tax=Streptomyces sp. NPDC056401 TaxID=3345809 RepID=UPI0035DC3AF4